MDTLIKIIIAGFAVGYVVEFFGSVLARWLSPKTVRLIFTYPLNLACLVLLGLNGAEIFVCAAAGGFVGLVVMMGVSRPVEVSQVISRR